MTAVDIWCKWSEMCVCVTKGNSVEKDMSHRQYNKEETHENTEHVVTEALTFNHCSVF